MQKKIDELVSLIKRFGYWSDEVQEFNGKMTYTEMSLVNQKAKLKINQERDDEQERTGRVLYTLIS